MSRVSDEIKKKQYLFWPMNCYFTASLACSIQMYMLLILVCVAVGGDIFSSHHGEPKLSKKCSRSCNWLSRISCLEFLILPPVPHSCVCVCVCLYVCKYEHAHTTANVRKLDNFWELSFSITRCGN